MFSINITVLDCCALDKIAWTLFAYMIRIRKKKTTEKNSSRDIQRIREKERDPKRKSEIQTTMRKYVFFTESLNVQICSKFYLYAYYMPTFYYIVSYYRQMCAFRICIFMPTKTVLSPSLADTHNLLRFDVYQVFSFKHQLYRSKFSTIYFDIWVTQMAFGIVLTNFPNVYHRYFHVEFEILLHISLYIKWIMIRHQQQKQPSDISFEICNIIGHEYCIVYWSVRL